MKDEGGRQKAEGGRRREMPTNETRRRTRAIRCFVTNANLHRMIFGLFRLARPRRVQETCAEFLRSRFVASDSSRWVLLFSSHNRLTGGGGGP